MCFSEGNSYYGQLDMRRGSLAMKRGKKKKKEKKKEKRGEKSLDGMEGEGWARKDKQNLLDMQN